MVYYHAGFTGRAEPILFMLEERGLQYTIKPMAELPTGEGACRRVLRKAAAPYAREACAAVP